MEDRLIIGYDQSKNPDLSCLVVAREKDGIMIVINEFTGSEAKTLYNMLIGYIKLQKNVGYFFKIKNAEEDKYE